MIPFGTLVVQEFENVCVCSGVNLLGRSEPLCRFVGRVIVCQVLCAIFMRFVMRKCVTVIDVLICHQYIV